LRIGLTLACDMANRLLRPQGGMFAMLHAMATQAIGLALNLATGIMSARLLGPTGRGEFAAVILWLQLPSLLAIAGIQNAIVYQTGRRPEQAASISVAGFLLSTALFIPMALICFWWMPGPMHAYGPSIIALAQVVLILSVISAWSIIVRQSLLAVRNFHGYNSGGYGSSLVYFLILLALVGLERTSPQDFVWAQLAALAGVLIILTVALVARWDWRSLHPFACIADLAAYAWASENGVIYYLGKRKLTVRTAAEAEAAAGEDLDEGFRTAAARLRLPAPGSRRGRGRRSSAPR